MHDNDKNFKIIEHPSDVGISISSTSLEGAFESAAKGMFSIICDPGGVKPLEIKKISISCSPGMNYEDLMISWLERLLYLHEVNKMLFSRFEVIIHSSAAGKVMLKATVYGEKIAPERHELYLSVKAPTYHKLSLHQDGVSGKWQGRVIFDV